MNPKYLFCLPPFVFAALALAGQPNEASLAERTIKEYMRSQANVEVRVEHLRIVGKFARATAAPIKAHLDPAMVFLKKVRGQWIGVSYGTDFLPEDCQKLGLPSEICP